MDTYWLASSPRTLHEYACLESSSRDIFTTKLTRRRRRYGGQAKDTKKKSPNPFFYGPINKTKATVFSNSFTPTAPPPSRGRTIFLPPLAARGELCRTRGSQGEGVRSNTDDPIEKAGHRPCFLSGNRFNRSPFLETPPYLN